MARIAFAWELGAELGHAMACATLSNALAARGHESVFILRELHQLHALPGIEGRVVFQAPLTPREGQGAGVPDSPADILLGCGYASAQDLRGLLAGWIELLRHTRADLLVADYAPTALLAARVLGMKRVTFSNGFAIPPRLVPMPPFRVDAQVDPGAVARSEAQVLANVNRALESFGARPLGALREQFETAEDFLCTFPELDHFGNRPVARYWGPRYSIDRGEEVRWPYGEGPRVLMYLQGKQPFVDALAEALVSMRCRVVAYMPGLDDARRARLQSAQRRLASRPMKLAPLLAECDAFVGHGGDTAAAALLHGVPQLVFPLQYEQLITASRLEQLGAGVSLARARNAADIAHALRRVLDPRAGFRAAAQAYAKRYPQFSPEEQRRRIVARIEAIVHAGVPA
jgi:UDP:flavonoid glycosyltransferase YjiC (YdhE family)